MIKRISAVLATLFALALLVAPASAQLNTDDEGMELQGFANKRTGDILAVGYIELDSESTASFMVELMAEDLLTGDMSGVKEVTSRDLPPECIAFTGRMNGDKTFAAMCQYKTGAYMFLTTMDTDDAVDYVVKTMDRGKITTPTGFTKVDMD